ncbi:MAG: DUF58 domain-containing protein [Treponema sp.]|jgi:uncharacterized protein (DUF58 family)|nr:DUF58 domain-containing protein [Treponema sp.]
MDTRELLGRITKLPIVADTLAEEMLSGNFRSVFRGQGMEFEEARHYQWGDDAKSIDWNASARLGTPFIKVFREERELTILLLLDVSASMRCGIANPWGNTQGLIPYEQALITAALIAFSSERSGQRVGAFLFDSKVDRVFPPRKGRRNILAFVSGALHYHQAKAGTGKSSNLGAALAGAGRLLKRRSMVVLISDFLSADWEKELCDLSRRHDVIAVRVYDPENTDLPKLGLLEARDPETGLRIAVPSNSVSFRGAWAGWHKDRAEHWLKLCRRAGASHLELPVGEDPAKVLSRFFTGRSGQ